MVLVPPVATYCSDPNLRQTDSCERVDFRSASIAAKIEV
jgi:hypothetical protein